MSNKLYIWFNTDTCPSYSGDGVFVLAPNLRSARKLALKAQDWRFAIDTEERREFVLKDQPTLVIDKPDAVYFMYGD